MSAPTSLKHRIQPLWAPPEKVYAEEWIPNNVKTPEGSEYEGYCNYNLAPHTRDVFRAFDDDHVREIYLIWATRSAKTSTTVALMMHAAVNRPKPMAFGSCDQPSTDRTVEEMIYPMIENCEATVDLVPPEGKRPADTIPFDRCRVRKAFGGSPGTVAGYPACYLFGNEWDKWPHRKSSEAQPANSFKQRAKGYPFESKAIYESTPGHIETSRIWKLRNAKRTQRREFYVPCPHCLHHQTLKFEQLSWEGKDDPEADEVLAAESAVYLCEDCGLPIQNEDRAPMMRAGKWIAEGQTVDRNGEIHDEPTVNSGYICFGPLSTLYSLLISGWDQIVAEWLACGDDQDKIRDFTNSTLALPWDPAPDKVDPHEIGVRLKSDEDVLAVCPLWSIFLTFVVDVQSKLAGWEFPWQACSWGIGGRGSLVDYGTASGFEELSGIINGRVYPHADGGTPLQPVFTLIDSGDGNATETIYGFCRQRERCHPLKGMSHPFVQAFTLNDLSDAKSNSVDQIEETNKLRRFLMGEMMLVGVNTFRSQMWLHRILEGRTKQGDNDWFSIPPEAAENNDLLEEFVNEYPEWDFGSNGFQIKGWKRRTRNPNDQRDLLRYSWTSANIITNHGSEWWMLPSRAPVNQQETTPQHSQTSNPLTAGGGRQWPNR